jgi:glyoxylase-like metal-dependent hydrolase (beta-lactamase superfamily II)
MRPDDTVEFWEGDARELLPGLMVVRCGGHFPGSSVLHWASGAGGRGALFTGDTINVVADRRYVSFMYSYPNQIPLNARTVRAIVAAVEPYAFDRIYGSWSGSVVAEDAKAAVRRSAERYIAHIQD